MRPKVHRMTGGGGVGGQGTLIKDRTHLVAKVPNRRKANMYLAMGNYVSTQIACPVAS